MNKIGVWMAFAAVLYALQTSLCCLIAYHGVTVNLLLLLVVSFAFLKGHRLGVLMGFCAGLLQDLASGTFFGCSIISYMTIGWVCGKLSDNVFKEEFFLPVVTSVFVTTGHYLVFAVLMQLMGYRFHLVEGVWNMLLPMLAYQFLFAYPVHKLACRLERWLHE